MAWFKTPVSGSRQPAPASLLWRRSGFSGDAASLKISTAPCKTFCSSRSGEVCTATCTKTLSPTRILHVLRHVRPLCAADEIPYSNLSANSVGSRFALLPTRHPLGLSSALRRTPQWQLNTALSLHSICIGPAPAATTGGLVQTALSNARRAPRPTSRFRVNAHPIEH